MNQTVFPPRDCWHLKLSAAQLSMRFEPEGQVKFEMERDVRESEPAFIEAMKNARSIPDERIASVLFICTNSPMGRSIAVSAVLRGCRILGAPAR